ncbi:TRAP transporter small permease [Oceanibium sediminis]|uniref:TRAP transporter small permease n=1 Tax=Oceanibium sediminis TaxID=2026339 RepID=UPI000DD344DE|nr:TRAP transporter small permease [Oceanibium sediminis]
MRQALLFLDAALNRLYRICGMLAACFIVAIVGVVMVRILSRLMGFYVPGLAEYAGYCLAIAGALGLAYTFGEHGHIRVEMLIEKLRGKTRFRSEVFVLAFAAAISSYVAWYTIRLAHVSWLYEDHSSKSDEILLVVPQAPFALGFTLFTICLVHTLVRVLLTGELAGLSRKSDGAQ